LTTYLFLKILKICNSKILKITLFSLLIILTISSFCQKTEYIYEQKIFYSEAYSTIVKNYKPNDVIFGQYLKKYYLKELGNFKVVTVDMMNNKLYTYESFIEDLKKYDSGWIVWDTGKTGHLKREIIDYSCKNFEHLHGEICNEKIDDTKVEVFYFDKNMIG